MTSKPYNNGTWTAARFHSFIKSGLRSLSLKWPPRHKVKKAAWRKRGQYECAGYNREPHIVKASEIQIDHIEPVALNIDQTWDSIVERMFCNDDGLQALCKTCHKKKTKVDNNGRKSRTRSG